MCVIAVVKDARPSERMVRQMWTSNSDGGGVAYRDVAEDANGEKIPVVAWKKGLTLDDMIEAAKELPTPYIMHFRKRSIGETSDELCHPFLVTPDSPLDLEGTTTGYVLFHNGTFKEWNPYFFNFIVQRGMKFPQGSYSDSRALAIMASEAGIGIMDCLGAKGVAFSPFETEIFEGRDNIENWKRVENIWVSNDKFHFPKEVTRVPSHYPHNGGSSTVVYPQQTQQTQAARNLLPKKNDSRIYCKDPQCIVKEGFDDEGFCEKHSKKKSVSVTDGKDMPGTKLALPPRRKVKPGLESPFQATVDQLRETAVVQGPLVAATLALAALNDNPPRLSKSQWKRLQMEFQSMEAKLKKNKAKELTETFASLLVH